nr:PREDICTED: voltage-dependent L-type calcium channel subunit alpha-1F-like [Paralichthys olivaceus]
MTSEEEEGPSVATSAAPTATAISRVTTAIAGGDSDDAVTSSSPRGPSPYHLPCPEEKEEKEEEIEEEGIILEEERIEEEEEEEVVECDEDDASSDTSVLIVPYPELVPVVFFCLKQTTCPRSLCIRMVSSPYPFSSVNPDECNLRDYPPSISSLIIILTSLYFQAIKKTLRSLVSLKSLISH